MVVNQGEIVQD